MPRKLRILADGGRYHIINRRVDRQPLFDDDLDYRAFEKVLDEIAPLYPMRIIAYCRMPNHWHLLVWPEKAAALPTFIQRLTLTHMRQWHAPPEL